MSPFRPAAPRCLAALLLLAVCFPAQAQSTRLDAPGVDTVTVSLEQALQRALAVSPDILIEEAGQAYAEARSRQARASRFATEFQAQTAHAVAPGLKNRPPGVDDEALYLVPELRNDWEDLRPFNRLEVDLGQPLYTWGELGGSIRAARHGVAVEAAGVDAKRLEVARRTADLYYGLLLTEELFRLTERAGEAVGQARREIQRLLDEGAPEVDDADLFQVQITEQEFNRRVVEVTQQRRLARAALARQLMLPEGTAVAPVSAVLEPLAFTPDTLSVYLTDALAHRPEIAQAAAGLAAREALVDVARSDYYPKLFLGVQARYSYAAGRIRQPNPFVGDPFLGRSLRAGFGLRQNLNFWQTKAKVEQAEAERNEVRHQQDGARQLVLLEAEQAYRNVLIAQAALDAQTESLRLSKEWLRTEQINFDLDLGDTDNLIKAVQANLQLEAGYYEAVRKYNLSVLDLLRATGQLLPRAQHGTLVD